MGPQGIRKEGQFPAISTPGRMSIAWLPTSSSSNLTRFCSSALVAEWLTIAFEQFIAEQ